MLIKAHFHNGMKKQDQYEKNQFNHKDYQRLYTSI